MQHVDTLSALAGKLDQAFRRHQRRGLVTPERMRAGVALDAQSLAIVEPVFVLGMKCGAPPDHLEDPAQAFVVLDQQRAGGGADEHLDAGAAGRAFSTTGFSGCCTGYIV